MNVEQLINKHLDNSNSAAAFALYEQSTHGRLSTETAVKLARAYYVQQQYERCLGVLAKIPHQNDQIAYQLKVLQFKCEYLCRRSYHMNLQELYQLVRKEGFQPHHRVIIEEFEAISKYREERRTRQDLQKEGSDFAELYRKEEARGAFAFEGFPMFLVAKRWFNIWRSSVFLDGLDAQSDGTGFERPSAGIITQFELLDHPYRIIYDTTKQKLYTNRYLFEGVDYELLTKRCWTFLTKRYGGIPITRYNISLLERPTEVVTQVLLKKLEFRLMSTPHNKILVQISRKETWQALVKKVEASLGRGVMWKVVGNTSRSPLSLKAVIEDEDLSKSELYYQQNGKLPVTNLNLPKVVQPPITKEACAACGKYVSLRFCSCLLVKYCNSACQEAHRSKHRKFCESKKKQESQMNGLVEKFGLTNEQKYANRKGLMGLANLGNTCYMNSGLQCLSNTRQLTEYFMTNKFLAEINSSNPLSSNGVVACCYSKLIRELWTGKDTYVSPWELKKAISNFAPQFAGYGQHDSQELISTLLDALHEDTNLVKVKQQGEIEDDDRRTDEEGSRLAQQLYDKRNKSFVSSLINSQFKSTAKCPCGRISKSFDPFMMVSLPVPQAQIVYVYFLGRNCVQLPLRFSVVVTGSDTVEDVVERICDLKRIRASCLKLYGLDNKFQITYEFKPSERADSFKSHYIVFAYELDYGNNEELIRIEYLLEDRGEHKRSYPRFLSIPKRSLTKEYAQALVMKDVRKYTRDTPNPQHYEITMESNNIIRVLIHYKAELTLQNYISHREELEGRRKSDTLGISDCLALFQKEEMLDKDNSWYCNKCKKFVQAYKQIQIYKANRVLMLGFKRFRLGRKIQCRINFPVNGLDMGPYILSTALVHSGNIERRPVLYDLYAVANHYGTMMGGHYTAFCKNFLDGCWYEFNDSKVSRVREDEVVSSSAYVLFYRLRD